MSVSLIAWIVAISIVVKCTNSAAINAAGCPKDCICYPDYLSNLASWKWIENEDDRHVDLNDPDHEEFNPYIEHNEVYKNPASKKYKTDDPLKTVTCIIRNGSLGSLTKMFNEIGPDTQVLSLLQAAGAGNININEKYFEHLRLLIGVQFQGYKNTQEPFSPSSTFKLGSDALIYLDKLVYLSLENLVIQEREVENQISDTDYIISTIIKFVRAGNVSHIFSNVLGGEDNQVENDLQSQLMFLSPKEESNDDELAIVPYNTYKKQKEMHYYDARKQPTSLEPKVKVAFTNIPSLLQLRISECNLEGISWDMFYKLNNLMYLMLEKNDLLFLPDFVFYATPNLTALSLTNNRILSLQTIGLAGLLQLQKLDVTSNNITYLSELSLPPFPHLEIADFRLNPIETIFPNTFEVMNTTKTLYLGNPSVPLEFLTNSFYGLVALTKLEIDNVRIEFLEKPMLRGMPQLKTLIMNGKIVRISFDAFNEVPKLEKLILKKCSTRKISMDAFYGLTSLVELDLSHNQLTFLPPGLLDEQIQLQEIYLQHNQLVTLPQKLFIKSPLKIVRLDENQWHCSCDMAAWDYTIINQVKRYGIVKNKTLCQRQYDKGSMCLLEHVKFQAKYVYEKRVSPVCATPSKFSQRSVFEVIRKEFKYCTISSTSINDTEKSVIGNENPITALLKISTPSKFTIVKTEEQIKKQKEKDLYFANLKPMKFRKPQTDNKPIISTTSTSSSQNSQLPLLSSAMSPTTSSQDTTKEVLDAIMNPVTQSTITSETESPEENNSSSTTSTTPIPTLKSTEIMSTPTESLENIIPVASTQNSTGESSHEESAATAHYNKIIQVRNTWHENTFQTTRKPFQSIKDKLLQKNQKQIKFDFTKPSVLSKNALKLARIQRRLEKRM